MKLHMHLMVALELLLLIRAFTKAQENTSNT